MLLNLKLGVVSFAGGEGANGRQLDQNGRQLEKREDMRSVVKAERVAV